MKEDRDLREEIRNIIVQLFDEYNIVHNIGEIKEHLERVGRYIEMMDIRVWELEQKIQKILQVIDKLEKSEGGGG